MKITPYVPANLVEIKHLFTDVFSTSEGESEGVVIGNLATEILTETAASDFHCFVATDNEKIVGCIIFSTLLFDSDINAFILSPVAIATNYQKKGVGQNLINFGLNVLKTEGVRLVFTYGDIKFYSKVGFQTVVEKTVKAPLKLSYPEGWLGQSLVGEEISAIDGNSYCIAALNKPEYW